MKIAVFSDVHGNFKALKAVLEQIKDNEDGVSFEHISIDALTN